jgi:DNA-directed RNA polymerase specialized sigma24 family protein
MTTTPDEVSQLLRAWGEGDQTAFEKLMPLVYKDLRRMARRHMGRQGPGHTLRYFGGLSVEETAEVLKVSPETVARDWRMARAWLRQEIGAE